ncbi:hypothetical protein BBJ28_00024418, partial [Nothophytophthora sp. Chile5]
MLPVMTPSRRWPSSQQQPFRYLIDILDPFKAVCVEVATTETKATVVKPGNAKEPAKVENKVPEGDADASDGEDDAEKSEDSAIADDEQEDSVEETEDDAGKDEDDEDEDEDDDNEEEDGEGENAKEEVGLAYLYTNIQDDDDDEDFQDEGEDAQE